MVEFWYNLVKYKDYSLERVPIKYRDIVEHMLEEN